MRSHIGSILAPQRNFMEYNSRPGSWKVRQEPPKTPGPPISKVLMNTLYLEIFWPLWFSQTLPKREPSCGHENGSCVEPFWLLTCFFIVVPMCGVALVPCLMQSEPVYGVALWVPVPRSLWYSCHELCSSPFSELGPTKRQIAEG